MARTGTTLSLSLLPRNFVHSEKLIRHYYDAVLWGCGGGWDIPLFKAAIKHSWTGGEGMERGIIILDRCRTPVIPQWMSDPSRCAAERCTVTVSCNELLMCVVRCTINCCVPLNDIKKKSPWNNSTMKSINTVRGRKEMTGSFTKPAFVHVSYL
jgi:hypothetical protein